MVTESSRCHRSVSTCWHTDTDPGPKLADRRRFGCQARPGLDLSWDGTSVHMGVGELVFHPEDGGPVAQFLRQQCVPPTPE